MHSFFLIRSLPVVGCLVSVALCLTLTSAEAVERRPSVEAAAYPEAVLVTARSPAQNATCRFCGVLIDDRAVLTAAHGVVGLETWEVTAPYAKGGAATVQVQSARIHPDYEKGDFENDLAVLRLADAIELEQSLPVLHRGDLRPLGSRFTLVGRVENGKLSREQLFTAEVERFSIRGNINLYGGFPRLCERGDSGGPVFADRDSHQVVALIGGGLGASQANVPTDIYIPITANNRKWILAQIPHPESQANDSPHFQTNR
jgi:secreted trypsin-like serine protease